MFFCSEKYNLSIFFFRTDKTNCHLDEMNAIISSLRNKLMLNASSLNENGIIFDGTGLTKLR